VIEIDWILYWLLSPAHNRGSTSCHCMRRGSKLGTTFSAGQPKGERQAGPRRGSSRDDVTLRKSRANMSRILHTGILPLKLSSFNYMSDELLLLIANTCRIRVGEGLASKNLFLHSAKISDNDNTDESRVGVLHTRGL